ncbi:MAG: IPT/TIG domain-containing protein [Acidobacteriota bacterium]
MNRLLLSSAIFMAALSTAFAQPTVSAGGTLDGAGFYVGQPVAPGSMVSIFGSGLAASLQSADTVPWSTTLDKTSVTFNGIAAPLYFVSPGQINAQLPWNVLASGLADGNANIVVTMNGTASPPQVVPIGLYSPGVFSIPPGGGYAIAINPDGSLAAPAGSIPGFPTRPAHPGEALILLANGMGPVDSPIDNGQPSSDKLRQTTTTPEVLINGIGASVIFSGLSPQFPSINQVNIVVPNGVTGNSLPLQIRIGGRTSPTNVVIAVAP